MTSPLQLLHPQLDLCDLDFRHVDVARPRPSAVPPPWPQSSASTIPAFLSFKRRFRATMVVATSISSHGLFELRLFLS